MKAFKLSENSTKTWIALLVVILAASVLARVAAALLIGNEVVELPGTADQISYHNLAIRVLQGHGFSFGQDWWPVTRAGEPTAHWSFLYTFYLVGVYSLFGVNPVAARIIQAIIVGILHPFLVYQIGLRVMGRKPAVIAAGLTAFYAYFIYYAGTLMTEPFYITTILTAVYAAIRMTSLPGAFSKQKLKFALLLGLALGGTVLLRQLFLLLIPFFLVWIGWRERRSSKLVWLAQLVLPVAVAGLMILPFTLYNYQRFGQLVLLNTNSGYAFYWGNHPIYGTKFIPILPDEMGTYQELIPPELLGLNEAALDQALMKRAMQAIFADPGRYILLSLSRIPPYFQFWPSPDSGQVSNLSRVASFGLLWPFMLYGLARSAMKKRFRSFSSPEWLMLMLCVVYSGVHILTWTLIRYRLPVDGILLLFAGCALYDLYHLLKAYQARRLQAVKP